MLSDNEEMGVPQGKAVSDSCFVRMPHTTFLKGPALAFLSSSFLVLQKTLPEKQVKKIGTACEYNFFGSCSLQYLFVR